MLDRVPAQLAKAKDVETSAEVLEKSVFLAAHFDRKDDVQRLVDQLQQLLKDRQGLSYEKLIRVVAGSFRRPAQARPARRRRPAHAAARLAS